MKRNLLLNILSATGKVLLLTLFFLHTDYAKGQNINMPTSNTTYYTTGGKFYDNGGSGSSYSSESATRTLTLYPAITGMKVNIQFNSFTVESATCSQNYDRMYIYNGSSTSAAALHPTTNSGGFYTGCAANEMGTLPRVFTSTDASGALTISWKTDGSGVGAGWDADIYLTGSVCGGTFYDIGGPSGNYTNNLNYSYTFTPPAGQVIKLTFSTFSIASSGDGLRFYNGPNTSYPQIGPVNGYMGTSSPGTVTSTAADGSLTVNFYSNGSTVGTGWVAAVTCSTICTNPTTQTVTGGGCVGSATVGLSSSQSGVTYTLKRDGNTVTSTAGTGAALSWGIQSTAGTYTVEAGGGSYCTTTMSGSVVVTGPAPVDGTISAVGGTSVCLGSAITVAASGGTGTPYYWVESPAGAGTWNIYQAAASNSASNGFTYTPTAAGTYRIHARWNTACGYCWDHPNGGANCTTFPYVDFTVNALPSAPTGGAATPSTICSGASVSFSASGSGVSYRWYTASTGGSPVSTANPYVTNISGSGTVSRFAAAVDANGCESTTRRQVNVTVNTAPAQPGAFQSGTDTPCAGGSQSYSVNAVAGATSYSWSYSGTGATFSASTASPSQVIDFATNATGGTLSIAAVNSCGTGTARTWVLSINPALIASAGPDKTINCGGSSLTLDGATTLSTGGSCSATTIFSDNFETCSNNVLLTSSQCGWSQYNVSGSTNNTNSWALSSTGAMAGSRSLTVYNGSSYNAYSITTSANRIAYTTIDASGYNSLLLSFKWKAGGEITSGTVYDYGKVVWSTNGTTWNDVVSTQYYNLTTTQTVTNLNLSVGNDQVFYLGFRWICDNSTGIQPPFTIDDIVITGVPIWCSSATYAWSAGASPSNSLTPTVTTAGTYTLTVTSGNGCVTTDDVVVSNPTPPTDPANPTITSGTPYCATPGVTLTRAAAPPAGVVYYWQTSAGGIDQTNSGATYSVNATGTYYIRAYHTATQCWGSGAGSVSVTVNANPTVSISPTTAAICSGTPVTLTASGASTYSWSPSTGLSATTGTSVSANPASNTTYTVIGTAASGCTASATRVVTVNSIPAAPTAVTPSSATTICNGDAVNLNATSAGNTIRWYTVSSGGTNIGTSASGANFSVSPGSNTTYYAESYTPQGCASASRTATAVITVQSAPANASGVTSSYNCTTGAVTLTASGAGANEGYRWYNVATGGSVLATGTTYTITPTNSQNYYVAKYYTSGGSCESPTRLGITASAKGLDTYTASRATGITFTDISAATAVTSWRNGTSDDNLSNTLNIGFSFPYDGGTVSQFRVSTDGYITFNTATNATGSYLSICGDGDSYSSDNESFTRSLKLGTLQSIAPFYDDLLPNTYSLNSSVHYQLSGSSPNRVLTVQWRGMSKYVDTDNCTSCVYGNYNFQVKLYETSGNVEFVYGTMNASSDENSKTYSCGINSSSLNGTLNTAKLFTQQTANTATFGSTAQNGLTTVPASSSRITLARTVSVASTVVPQCIAYNFPTNGATNQCINSILSWTPVDGEPTAYDVYFGTSSTPALAASNVVPMYYNPGTLSTNTTYYWRIVPKNASGAATATMPTWSFTTGGGNTATGFTSSNGTQVGNTVSLCDGESTTITITGSLSEGSAYEWRAPFLIDLGCSANPPYPLLGNCQANSRTFSNLSAGTYKFYVTATGCNGTSSCLTITLNVNGQANTAPTSISSSAGSSVCNGGSTVLSPVGGTLGAGASYQWFAGSCGSSVIATTTNITVSPTTTTTYYVRRTGGTTCGNTTSCASITINIDNGPTVQNVTGGGSYCSGGSGVFVGLDYAVGTATYELYLNGSPTGISQTGGSAVLSFGNQTAAGTYTVVATSTATSCTSTMAGSATVVVNPLPTAYSVTGGGSYCSGGTGVAVGLSNSQSGVNYQLYYNSNPSGSPIAGTGSAISFGNQTAAGTYNIVGANATTGCTNPMTGNATITINALPTAYSVTGGGAYCTGGTGVAVGLGGSQSGVNYQLKLNGTNTGSPVAGTGSAISFGNQTAAGTYTVVATNASTTCSNTMTGSVAISINALPTAYSVTGGGAYCSGGTGVAVGLGGSQSGVNYQLKLNGTNTGSPVAGTGSAISFGNQTAAGTYTVVATNASTTCTNTMTGSVVITINALPTTYSVTGGGSYCSGGTGVAVGLSGSQSGVNYQLLLNGSNTGTPVAGTGSAISFGNQTAAGTYTVVATNASTTCSATMTGSAVITINALPTAFSVTGGGGYCTGGTGVAVGLGGSQSGVNYQLKLNGTNTGSPVAGTGSAISFGNQTAAGTYTVVATNASTTCTNTMTGSVVITINSLPTAFSVTGGGSYCNGGSGVAVGLGGSQSGVNYQLKLNGTNTGSPVAGTGSAISFGNQTGAGTYIVVATNASTTCTNTMTGSAVITIDPSVGTPTFTAGAATLCQGGTSTYTATAANGTVTYSIFSGGASINPTSGVVSSVTSSFVVRASAAGCNGPTTADFSVTVTPTATPSVSIGANPGTAICGSTSVTFTATPTNGGTTPSYQWKLNGSNVGTNSATYTNGSLGNGDQVSVVLTSNASCLSTTTATDAVTMTVSQPNLTAINASVATPMATGDYLWTGSTNTNWTTASNWFVLNSNGTFSTASSVPATSTNVFIVDHTIAASCVSSSNNANVDAMANVRNVTIGTDATLSFSNSQRLNVYGNYMNRGELVNGTNSVVAFVGSGNQNVHTGGNVATNTASGTLNKRFQIVIVDKPSGSVIQDSIFLALGNFTITNGTWDNTSGNWAMQVQGNWDNGGTGQFLPGTSTVTLSNGSARTVTTGYTSAAPTGKTFYNLTKSGNGNFTLVGDLVGGNDLNVTAGTLTANGLEINFNRDVISRGGTISGTDATITANRHITIGNGNGVGALVCSNCILNATSDLNIGVVANAGTITLTNGGTANIGRDVLLRNGNFTAGSATIDVARNWTNSGVTFTGGTSLVRFSGSGTSTITSFSQLFFDVEVTKNQGVKVTLADDFEATGDLEVTTGTFETPASITGKAKTVNAANGADFQIRTNGVFRVND